MYKPPHIIHRKNLATAVVKNNAKLASSQALARRNAQKDKSVKWIYYDKLRVKYDAMKININTSPKTQDNQ